MIKVMLNSHGLKSRCSKKRKKGRRIELMVRYIAASIIKEVLWNSIYDYMEGAGVEEG